MLLEILYATTSTGVIRNKGLEFVAKKEKKICLILQASQQRERRAEGLKTNPVPLSHSSGGCGHVHALGVFSARVCSVSVHASVCRCCVFASVFMLNPCVALSFRFPCGGGPGLAGSVLVTGPGLWCGTGF